jgi:hypothetical protein
LDSFGCRYSHSSGNFILPQPIKQITFDGIAQTSNFAKVGMAANLTGTDISKIEQKFLTSFNLDIEHKESQFAMATNEKVFMKKGI